MLQKILMIVEVSQKQNYIFSSKRLRENIERSEQIVYVTSSAFFRAAAAEFYSEEKNLVYAGGGHTVLQFGDRAEARQFAYTVTRTALERFPNMELFVKQCPYDENLTPKENLEELIKALERKKSYRRQSFRWLSTGVEKLDDAAFQPLHPSSQEMPAATGAAQKIPSLSDLLPGMPQQYNFPDQFEQLAGEDNFLAVVHIDGNAMGARVSRVYESAGTEWETCRKSLRAFSEGVDRDFKDTFCEMVIEIDERRKGGGMLPIRPLILAGDDVCFVTAGSIGLECARIFLERLSTRPYARSESEKPHPYAACAGVALVHVKYPFHRAYILSEELCSNAKRFGALLDAEGKVSAMDWHIEFGQMKDGLSEIRRDYTAEDGSIATLRPVVVHAPAQIHPDPVRTYSFFRYLCTGMQNAGQELARGKIKQLRSAFKQGEWETIYALQERQLCPKFQTLLDGWRAGHAACAPLSAEDPYVSAAADGGEKKKICLLLDAIEMLDHFSEIADQDIEKGAKG